MKNKYLDMSVSVLRIIIGLWFLHHGVSKFLLKPQSWSYLGQAMHVFGITFWPQFWGFMAVMTYVVGGSFLALGIYSKIAAGSIMFTMLVAFLMHQAHGDGIVQLSLLFLILLGLLVYTGGGSYTAEKLRK